MVKVVYLKESEAPAPPKKMSARALESLRIIQGIKEGQVAQVTPEEGGSLPGLKRSLSRAATSANIKVEVYESPEHQGSVFIKRKK
jgi:hypothetical protein